MPLSSIPSTPSCAGVTTVRAANSYSLGLQLGRLYLDGETNRDLFG